MQTKTAPDKKALRSKTMRAVKSQNTRPEMIVRRLIYALGHRYRLHASDLPGKPDIVFRSRSKVVFVHGCFWHGHDCPRGARPPRHNAEYWSAKIGRNRSRDAETAAQLTQMGWASLVVWECEIKHKEQLACRLSDFLGNSRAAVDKPENERAKRDAVIGERGKPYIAHNGQERLDDQQCCDKRGDEADCYYSGIVEA